MKKIINIILVSTLFYSIGFAQNCDENHEKYAIVNESLTLDASRDWPLPLTYTWFKNGVLINNTMDSLVFSSLELNDRGYYRCERKCDSCSTPEVICFNLIVNEQAEMRHQGEYPDDELVVWYDENASDEEKQAIRDTLTAKGAILARSCLCDIELWDNVTSDIVEAAGVRQTVQDTLDEDQGYNYRIAVSWPEYCISNYQLRPETLPDFRKTNLNKVKVGILDTGFETSHPIISPFLWQNNAPIDNCCSASDLAGYNAVDYCSPVIDSQGHGTAVASLIADFVPQNINMDLMNVKVINKHGGNLFDLICGGYFAIKNEAKIINMSFGYYGERSNLLERFVRLAKENNVLLVTSAGNRGSGKNDHWPSGFAAYTDYDHIVSVGSVDGDLNKMQYSSNAVIYAVGHNLICPAAEGQEVLKSGTSFAASFVTGIAATILSEDNLLPNKLIQRLLSPEYSTSYSDLQILNVDMLPYDENNNPVYFPDDTLITDPILDVRNIDVRGEIQALSIVDSSSVTHFRAGNKIRLTPGFNAKRGSTFQANVEECHTGISPLGRQNTVTEAPAKEEFPSSTDLASVKIQENSPFVIQPNPFSTETTLQFLLQKPASVYLSIFNALGQEIQVLVNGSKEKGTYSYTFSAGDLSAGLYYAVLRKNDKVLTRKLIVSR